MRRRTAATMERIGKERRRKMKRTSGSDEGKNREVRRHDEGEVGGVKKEMEKEKVNGDGK